MRTLSFLARVQAIQPGIGTRDGDQGIFFAPDHANRYAKIGDLLAQYDPLLIPVQKYGQNRFQSGLDSIQPLKSKEVFDKLARDQSFVGKQPPGKNFQQWIAEELDAIDKALAGSAT